MSDLIGNLLENGWLKTPAIIEAFKNIKRVDFLSEDSKNLAQLNEALPIGYGQTISQPLVVAFMLELLKPQVGEKILDIGAGSGWTTALLAYIVSQKGDPKSQAPNPKGRVLAIEVIQELKEFGERNVRKYNFIEKGIVEFLCADGSKGYEKEAPFDKILCSAAVQKRDWEDDIEKVPSAWKEQLKIDGRIVTPIGPSIWLFEKISETEFKEKEYPGFTFVPLVKK